MFNRKVMALLLGLSLFAVMGLAGCKNVCQRAADHMKGCIEDHCAEADDDDAMCQAMMASLEEDQEVPECNDENEAQARAALQLSCDQLFGGGQ